ncbi:MAG: alkaline phosphatase family protein [Kosmotoga sp.]|nr:MAG: alkaline phosphatase family protein [Kosmotoga sp.]
MDFSTKNIDLYGIDKIVVFLLDALSYRTVEKLISVPGGFLRIKPSSMKHITSVFPSTTTSALTSLFTGVPPIEHGMLGYMLYLKEYGGLSNMIELTPFGQARDGLQRIGLDPLKFLEVPTIFETLYAGGVKGYHITSKSFVNTGLSRMHTRGGYVKGIYGFGDMMEEINDILSGEEKKSLIYSYWGLVDTFGHRYGSTSQAYEMEAYWILKMIDDFFERKAKQDTAFFIMSDHGQKETPWEKEIWWSNNNHLYDCLYSLPAGEHRACYLHTTEVEKTKDFLTSNWGDKLLILERDEAIEKGLFGTEKKKKYIDRIGEIVVIPTDNYSFCFKYSGQENSMRARHGGLTEDEMKIPLIFLRK